ncbi:hypothetical protein ABFS83_08G140900 [Erythranthe nasuta]
MEGGGSTERMINGGKSPWKRTEYGRPIPKRGQVKAAIVSGLAQSMMSTIFPLRSRSQS